MQTIKTGELSGATLDWAVAKCEGDTEIVQFSSLASSKHYFAPSKKWAQGGPIIEREGIALRRHSSGTWYATLHLGDGKNPTWARYNYLTTPLGQEPALLLFDGPTPLIAAMRCYVASRLGDTVEVPEELL